MQKEKSQQYETILKYEKKKCSNNISAKNGETKAVLKETLRCVYSTFKYKVHIVLLCITY